MMITNQPPQTTLEALATELERELERLGLRLEWGMYQPPLESPKRFVAAVPVEIKHPLRHHAYAIVCQSWGHHVTPEGMTRAMPLP